MCKVTYRVGAGSTQIIPRARGAFRCMLFQTYDFILSLKYKRVGQLVRCIDIYMTEQRRQTGNLFVTFHFKLILNQISSS